MTNRVHRRYSFAAIPEWVLQHPDLSANAVRVFGILARFEDAFPSLAYVAERAHMSESNVKRSIRELKTAHAISVTARKDAAGRQTSNMYELADDRPVDEPSLWRGEGAAGEPPEGAAGEPPEGAAGEPPVVRQEKTQTSSNSPPAPPSERSVKKSEVDEQARNLARRFHCWYRETYGIDHPQGGGEVGLQAVFRACLVRGWKESEVRSAAKALDAVLSLNVMTKERNRQRANGNGERWAVPQ